MIISHKYRFIFIKTRKTAGTSLEIALSRLLGPHDVITPITPNDEALRLEIGGLSAQNYKIPKSFWRLSDLWPSIRDRELPAFHNHDSASFVREHVPDDIWQNYFKFTIERNPWDKFVSFYFWRNRMPPRPGFSDYLNSPLLYRIDGFDQYSIDGQVAVDKVYCFEDLNGMLKDLERRFSLSEPLEMPRTKSGYRKPSDARELKLSSSDCDKISKRFYREIELFNYQPPMHLIEADK